MIATPSRERIDAMVQNNQLTERQAEVAYLLGEGYSAREIGDRVGISRNAVYQQIQAMKRKGLFDANYTPSGEVRTPPGRAHEVLSEITRGVDAEPAGAAPAHMQVIHDLVAQNAALIEIIANMQRDKG